jgi:uncharacterized protein (DUF427 family)
VTTGHTITVRPADSRVEVRVGGTTVAASDRALVLHETGLRPRYYLPREDVRTDLLKPTEKATACPFKGQASYWSLELGDETWVDLVWSYETPIPERADITGLLCFYDERVELLVGVPLGDQST